jgi:hypothetical protein
MSEFTDLFLPPVLETPGLRFVGMTKMPSGAIALRFQNFSDGHVREVLLYVLTAGIVEYAYAITDRDLTSTRYYRGQYGNPEKDDMVEITSWPF